MNKMYIVKYCGGSYDDYYNANIFVTSNKSTAIKYVKKFNRILKKWKKYYSQFENKDEFGFTMLSLDITNDYYYNKYYRWNYLSNIDECYYDEISVR
jgi:hypothetical protein